MRITRLLRNVFIGKNERIASQAEFKRVMLAGYLSLLVVVSNWAFMLIEVFSQPTPNYILNSIFCFVGIICLVLLRLKKYTFAKLLLFISSYIIIFTFCTFDPFQTGVSVFFIVISIGALALFGYEQRLYGYILTAFGAILFFMAYVADVKFLDISIDFSEAYVYNNFILNFFIALIASFLILFFMVDVNHYSETSLRKKEGEALEKNKELIKLNAELDRFVYSVSHDLRSPLSTISGLVNIGKHADSVEEAKKYFVMIGDRLRVQDFFIREIIDFYRNSRTEISREPFILKEQVQEIVDELFVHAVPTLIEYRVDIPEELEVRSDKIRMKSVLSNLIGNAVKYHDISKPEKYVRIGAEKKNGQVLIFVEDNGQGIGKEHLAKLFDMFYRASADSKGSGLGLFIAQETVTKLGGKIQVDSTLGQGSRFTFSISS